MRKWLRIPWTVQFVARHSRFVTVASAWRLRNLVCRDSGLAPSRVGLVSVRVKQPFVGNVALREPGSDLRTFQEVVVAEIYRGIAERAKHCQYVFDLGANIGLTSLYFAAAFPQCQIVAVEPHAGSHALLQQNLRSLALANRCRTVCGAVWDQDGYVALVPPAISGDYDSIQIREQAKQQDSSSSIIAYSIESLMRLSGFPRIDILKVDIEGAELQLFRSSPAWLDRVNAIAIEFHKDSRQESCFDENLRSRGFVVENDRYPHTAIALRPSDQWRT